MRSAARARSATVKPLQQLHFRQTFYQTPLEYHRWYSGQSKTYTMEIPSLPTSRAFDEHRNTSMMFMFLPLCFSISLTAGEAHGLRGCLAFILAVSMHGLCFMYECGSRQYQLDDVCVATLCPSAAIARG